MAWPDASALVAYASAQGLELSSEDAEALLSMAVSDFESMVGHSPFYATGAATARNVPGDLSVVLDLQCGAQSVASVYVSGVEVPTTSYRLVWRGVQGQPRSWVRGVEAASNWGLWSDGAPSVVSVTADWGAVPTGSSLASGVNRAVMDKALMMAADASHGGDVTEVRQGPVTLKYGSGGSVDEKRARNYAATVAAWARVVV